MSNPENPDLYTVKQFCERNPWATQSMLRWQIHQAEKTGFDKCIYRFGHKVLIDEKAVFEWMKKG